MKKYLLVLFIALFLLNGCRGQEKPKETPSKPESQEIKTQLEETTVKETDDIEKQEVKEITTKNKPPMITSITVTPQFPKKGDVIKVDVNATDPDGDKFDFIYEWTKNREPLFETTNTLILTDNFERGDKIKLIVTPYDETAKGTPGFMDVAVGNSPPEITSSPNRVVLKNRQFSYQVKATDADKDTLAYNLKTAPAGMTINQGTGLIQWDVPEDFKGKTTINVSVTDGHGGEGIQNFIVEIMAEIKE